MCSAMKADSRSCSPRTLAEGSKNITCSVLTGPATRRNQLLGLRWPGDPARVYCAAWGAECQHYLDFSTREVGMRDFLIYGANGYTGALIARAAVARGHRPLLAGRNAAAL